MADAKFVVEDHRNGDAKIELDANKRQFSGLTKEELLKYADDPFWVNLRWFMFVLFWTAWLAMLAGAIAIIVRAPKCPSPTPKTWLEKGPLVDMGSVKYEELESDLQTLKNAKVEGIFMDAPTYDILDGQTFDKYKNFFTKAKEYGVNVIVDLIPNYVSSEHSWFKLSENKTDPFTDYFVWKAGGNGASGTQEPNNWVSMNNEKAWNKSDIRGEYYLHHYAANQPDLNFFNKDVQAKFNQVLGLWLKAGVNGIRLNKVRQLLVDQSFSNEEIASPKKSGGADLEDHQFWQTKKTSDHPLLDSMLSNWAELVDKNSTNPGSGDVVFTMEEEKGRTELYRARNLSGLRPPSTAPITVDEDVDEALRLIKRALEGGQWPAIQLEASPKEAGRELASFAALLPATPVITFDQIKDENDTDNELFAHLAALRKDPSIAHGQYIVTSVGVLNSTYTKVLACARWKTGSTGFVGVYNPTGDEVRANLTSLANIPETVSVHHVTNHVKAATDYTNNYAEAADNVIVPAYSSIILSYVPKTAVEN